MLIDLVIGAFPILPVVYGIKRDEKKNSSRLTMRRVINWKIVRDAQHLQKLPNTPYYLTCKENLDAILAEMKRPQGLKAAS